MRQPATDSRARWIALCLVGPLLAAQLGCKASGRNATSPERLRDAYVAALEADDPKAAYGLLSAAAQAKTPFVEFEARWKADAAERQASIDAAKNLPEDQKGATRSGSTTYPGGRVVLWTEVGGEYAVVSGLPGRPQTATPAQTIRSFIDAVRRAELSEVRGLLSPELAAALNEDWEARVDAIEAALEDPGALELSSDVQSASLHYEPQRAMSLRQTPEGWRIVGLE